MRGFLFGFRGLSACRLDWIPSHSLVDWLPWNVPVPGTHRSRLRALRLGFHFNSEGGPHHSNSSYNTDAGAFYIMHYPESADIIPLCFSSLLIGTLCAVVSSDIENRESISDCVAGWSLSGCIFKLVVCLNAPLLVLICWRFRKYALEWEKRYAANSNGLVTLAKVQFYVAVVGISALLGVAFFPVREPDGTRETLAHDLHMISAALFFLCMYCHLLGSVFLQYKGGQTLQRLDKNSGFAVLRLFSAFTGGLILGSAVWSNERDDAWIFPQVEWLYVATFATYLFTFWRELVPNTEASRKPVFGDDETSRSATYKINSIHRSRPGASSHAVPAGGLRPLHSLSTNS